MESLIFLIVMGAAMWLLLIRPQQKRVLAQRNLIEALAPGQRVVTAGGLIGTIEALGDDEIELRVGNSRLTLVRGAVARVIEPQVSDSSLDSGSWEEDGR